MAPLRLPVTMILIMLSAGCLAMTKAKSVQAPLALTGKRIAFLGDSITDGHTLPLLIEQSLKAARVKSPRCTNVAVAGNRSYDMLARLERDVIPLRPDYLALSAGTNDAGGKVPAERYTQHITAILERMRQAGTEVIILTTTPLHGARNEPAKPYIDAYNAALRQLAKQYGCRVAEIWAPMQRSLGAGESPLSEDGIHLSFAGYRIMARAVLDAFGYSRVPIVEELSLTAMPGIIEKWRIRPAPANQALTEKEASNLEADVSWKTYLLPEQERISGDWWLDQERQRGFAVNLASKIGLSPRYHGVAELSTPKQRGVTLNTGAGLRIIWLNGKKVYESPRDSGWHAGRERIAVTLNPGRNSLVIETDSSFFLSVTPDSRW